MNDVISATALEMAGWVRSREIGAVELLEAHLVRIEARDGELQAFVQLFEHWARRHARKIDASRNAWPDPLPTFFGVPFGIKDNDAMKWTYTRVGSRAYRFAVTPFDSLAVRRLRAAGFVMVGKTTTSEFALLPVVEPDIHPPTRNPWDPSRTAGGSSGGAAVAVATGMLPIAHGADGGGSIRIPASFCGLFGFKASRGVMPNFYAPMESVGLSVAGSLARSVEDSAAVLDALCGDPFGGPQSWRSRCVGEPASGLRVRFATSSSIGEVIPEVAAEVVRIAAVLEAMGHDVQEGGEFEGSTEEFVPVYGRLAANVPVLREESLQPVTQWLRAIGRRTSNRAARRLNAQLSVRLDDWFGDADLWVTPTVGVTAPEVGAYDGLPPDEAFARAAELGAFTAPSNITGQPAATIPVGASPAGLPIGVQIIGRRGADELVMRVARALGEAGMWRVHTG